MKTEQVVSDRLAIGLSLVCAIHCLVLPFILILLPGIVVLQLLNNDIFHALIIIAVLPISIYTLTLGCRQHKCYQLLVPGIAGLLLLVTAVILGEETAGEFGEKFLTVLGASLVAIGHLWNYRLRHKLTDCAYPKKCKPDSR